MIGEGSATTDTLCKGFLFQKEYHALYDKLRNEAKMVGQY